MTGSEMEAQIIKIRKRLVEQRAALASLVQEAEDTDDRVLTKALTSAWEFLKLADRFLQRAEDEVS